MSHLYLILFEIFYCARAWEKATPRKYHMQKLNISIDTQSRQTIALNIKRSQYKYISYDKRHLKPTDFQEKISRFKAQGLP